MKFGRDGAKSSYEHCKNEKRAKLEKETFETGTYIIMCKYIIYITTQSQQRNVEI